MLAQAFPYWCSNGHKVGRQKAADELVHATRIRPMLLVQNRRRFLTNLAFAGAVGLGGFDVAGLGGSQGSLAPGPPPEITTIRLAKLLPESALRPSMRPEICWRRKVSKTSATSDRRSLTNPIRLLRAKLTSVCTMRHLQSSRSTPPSRATC